MNKKNLFLPISIVLGCIILGGFFYAIQIQKQQSIERQQQAELNQKQVELKAEADAKQATQEEQLQKSVAEQANKSDAMEQCSKDAQNKFNDYVANLGSSDPNFSRQDNYNNHYNTVMGKCFITISSMVSAVGDSGAGSIYSTLDLIDVAENSTLASAYHIVGLGPNAVPNGDNTDEYTSYLGSQKQSISESQFVNIENQYMKE